MNEKPKNYGWTEKGIIGMIFTPIGLIFLPFGLLAHCFRGLDAEGVFVFRVCFGGMGAVFLVLGLVLLFIDLRRRRLQRSAYEGGYCVMAEIAGVRSNNHVNLNGRHPVIVEAHYTDPATGIVHVYGSRYLYVDVGNLLKAKEVPLYLDPMNPEAGFVDIDAVLPEIQVHR